MQTPVWVSIVSVIGVVLGGGLSYLVQLSVQRRTDRGDQRRRAHERAERAAEDRAATPAWRTSALDVVDELWVCERMIHILFASNLHDLVRAYVRALDHVLWQQPDDVSLWDYLQGPKVAFLAAARDQLSV